MAHPSRVTNRFQASYITQKGSCRLLHLPGELRLKIFAEIVVANFTIEPDFQPAPWSTPICLMLTCHQIWDEVEHLFYSSNRFAFNLLKNLTPLHLRTLALARRVQLLVPYISPANSSDEQDMERRELLNQRRRNNMETFAQCAVSLKELELDWRLEWVKKENTDGRLQGAPELVMEDHGVVQWLMEFSKGSLQTIVFRYPQSCDNLVKFRDIVNCSVLGTA